MIVLIPSKMRMVDAKACIDLIKEVGGVWAGLAPFGIGVLYHVPSINKEEMAALGVVELV